MAYKNFIEQLGSKNSTDAFEHESAKDREVFENMATIYEHISKYNLFYGPSSLGSRELANVLRDKRLLLHNHMTCLASGT